MEVPPLPAEVRATLSPVVRAYIDALEADAALVQSQVAALQVEMATLRERLAEAEARARQHSGNSSGPPSSDPPNAPARPAQAAGGRGGSLAIRAIGGSCCRSAR